MNMDEFNHLGNTGLAILSNHVQGFINKKTNENVDKHREYDL